jgi:tellurite resistance protein TerC
MGEAVRWSLLWFSLAFVFVAFCGGIWTAPGPQVANTVSMQFITGYLVERACRWTTSSCS